MIWPCLLPTLGKRDMDRSGNRSRCGQLMSLEKRCITIDKNITPALITIENSVVIFDYFGWRRILAWPMR